MNADEEAAQTAPLPLQRGPRGVLTAAIIALAVSVALNVMLAHRVRSITNAQAARIADLLLKDGSAVPPFTAKRLDGQHEVIDYDETNQPTVLYFFTPKCSWCSRNLGNFKALINNENGKYRFIAVSLSDEGLAEYVTKNELKLPVYFGLSTEVLQAYKLGGTPQTIVVSPQGLVLQNWPGAYVGSQKSQVEAFFHVTLPGISAESH